MRLAHAEVTRLETRVAVLAVEGHDLVLERLVFLVACRLNVNIRILHFVELLRRLVRRLVARFTFAVFVRSPLWVLHRHHGSRPVQVARCSVVLLSGRGVGLRDDERVFRFVFDLEFGLEPELLRFLLFKLALRFSA